ncbi:hypothetical protein Nepgr_005382 [Nepenthes gracilis]|uniref:Uncharacterized protein n=1 Tax=Nepenthes gracilis TaxID=150966 RepID=A0AAD3S323_NEPGR|nr:hypothetical protein Nepgr_005382 [Nepenthes gracilis]
MAGLNAIVNSQVVPLGEAVISVSKQEVSDSIPKVPLELVMPSESAKEVPEGPLLAHARIPAIEAIAGKNGVQFDEVGVPHCYNDDGGLPHCLCKGPVGALCIQSQHLEVTGCNAGENQDIESDPNVSSSQSSEEWTDEKSRMIHDAGSGILMLIWFAILLVVVRRTE